jgi:hypothetical protein
MNFKINLSSVLRFTSIATALVTTFFIAAPKSQATTLTLNFEGIVTHDAVGVANINDFYNGGTSSDGTAGTNYGITFSPNALGICMSTLTQLCTVTSRGGQGDPNSQRGGFYYASGTEVFLNYAGGFDTSISFFYTARNQPATVTVYDEIDGGNMLATVSLPITSSGELTGICANYLSYYCPFVASSISFTGTGKSIKFTNQNIAVFDDITFANINIQQPENGSTDVPEPFTIVGTLVGGTAAMRMRKKLKVTKK